MSANLTTHYARQYATIVDLLSQQGASRLRAAVSEGRATGDQMSPVDQIGSVEMNDISTRFSTITRTDAPTERRWVVPTHSSLAQLVDANDELKIITDPKAKYAQNGAAAAGRRMDNHVLTAFFADAKTGVQGADSTSFDSNNVVAVDAGAGSDTGMNVYKLRQARRLIKAGNVDLDVEELHCALNAMQEDKLLGETQIISVDYNARPVLVDGKLRSFLGYMFHHTELIKTDSNADHRIPVWVKSGVFLAFWQDLYTKLSQRDDLESQPWQIYQKMTCGATRLEEAKVVEIKCHPS